MTAQHTPAPWSFTNEPYDDGTPYISVFAGKRHSGDGFNICGIIRPEDARLIAAAPDLLAALQDCADDLEAEIKAKYANTISTMYPTITRSHARDMATVVAARAAITKATGK